MSEWTVHLEFEEGTSSKFWRARTEGKSLFVNYGKIGSAGQTQVKQFGTPDVAEAEYEKLVREKRRKGYVDSGGGGGGGEEEEDDEDQDDEGDEDEEAAPPPKKAAAPAPKSTTPSSSRPAGGTRMVLQLGDRTVESYIYVDGKTAGMESKTTYANPDAAKKAHDRLKKTLLGEGYKEG